MIGLFITTAAIIIVTNVWTAVLQIDGSSMNPLLQADEIVLVVRTDNPARNDIIAFYHNNKLHIKRVIALAGDLVDIDENGVVSINGETLEEPYVSELSRGNCDIEVPFMVPSGEVFVLGDNRPSSLDSRYSQFGTVNRDQIIGKVKLSLWPLSKMGSVK